jgi:hypothetical protein
VVVSALPPVVVSALPVAMDTAGACCVGPAVALARGVGGTRLLRVTMQGRPPETC